MKGLYAEQALRFTDATLELKVPTIFETFVKQRRRQKGISEFDFKRIFTPFFYD